MYKHSQREILDKVFIDTQSAFIDRIKYILYAEGGHEIIAIRWRGG